MWSRELPHFLSTLTPRGGLLWKPPAHTDNGNLAIMRVFYCRKSWAAVTDHLQPVFNLSAFKKWIVGSVATWDFSVTCSED